MNEKQKKSDFIHDGKFLYRFARENPHIKVIVSMDSGKSPLMIASYLPSEAGGRPYEHTKELPYGGAKEVINAMQIFRQRTGRHVSKKRWKRTETKNFSLQGRWYPGMWGKKISNAALIETHRHIPSKWDYSHLPERAFPINTTDIARQTVRKRLKRLRL